MSANTDRVEKQIMKDALPHNEHSVMVWKRDIVELIAECRAWEKAYKEAKAQEEYEQAVIAARDRNFGSLREP